MVTPSINECRPVVLYLGPDSGWQSIVDHVSDSLVLHRIASEPAALAAEIHQADAILDATTWMPIGKGLLDRAPRLGIISCASTGSRHVDEEAAVARGVKVHTLREDVDFLRSMPATAELAWGLLLSCARSIAAAHNGVLAGDWRRESYPGVLLHGRRLGIIGFGRLGNWMARYGHSFGMDVVAHDPDHQAQTGTVRLTTLEELIATSDVITLHVHLSDNTEGMIGIEQVLAMKKGVIVVNTSRGAVVDDDALLVGLKNGIIGAVGLDVLRGEPFVSDHPIVEYARTHTNVVLTPHIGGYVPEAVARACVIAVEKILRHFAPRYRRTEPQ